MPTQLDDLKLSIGKALIGRAEGIRQRRMQVEQRWLANRRMWMNAEWARSFNSTDTAAEKASNPAGRRSSEKTIIRGVEILTPKVKWYEVLPLDNDYRKAGNVDKYMQVTLTKRIRTRSNIGQLMRCAFLYGRATQRTSIKVVNGKAIPSQRVVDPFSFYIYPETCSTTEQAELQFEDYMLSYEKYYTLMQKGLVDKVREDEVGIPTWPYHLAERLAYQGITEPGVNFESVIDRTVESLKKAGGTYVDLTELWIVHEDKLYQTYHMRNHKDGVKCVGFVQSVYDEPTYRTCIHRALPGETYTTEMAGDIAALDNMQNDLCRQFFEQVDREQGMFFVDTSNTGGHRHDSWRFKGGGIWELNGRPQELVQFVQPPIVSTNILRAWQIVTGMVNSMGGTGTIAEGQPGRNMPRAGGAMNNLIELGMADIRDIAEMIEQEVLTPGLGDIYKLSMQFIPNSQLIRVPGGVGLASSGMQTKGVLRKGDLEGDYEFTWTGSIQSAENEAKAQQEMILLNLVSSPAISQQLAQQGYAVNLPEFIKMLWRDTLGVRGLADIILPIDKLKADLQTSTLEDSAGDGEGLGGEGEGLEGGLPVPGLKYNLPALTNGFVRK